MKVHVAQESLDSAAQIGEKKNYKHKTTQRLCSEHFRDGHFRRNLIPSIFGRKTFNTYQVKSFEHGSDESTIPREAAKPTGDCGNGNEHSVSDHQQINLKSSGSRVEASVVMHDYCGQIEDNITSLLVNKCDQTDFHPVGIDASTQTDILDSFYMTVSTQTLNDAIEIPISKPKMVNVEIQCNKPVLTYEDVSCSEKFSFYTGIPNQGVFKALFDEMDDAIEHTTRSKYSSESELGRPRNLRLVDEFFLVLMRLRLGLLLEDLADRFCVSKSTCSIIFDKWIDYLSIKLSSLTVWPSKTVIKKTMPKKFRKYPDTRVIIDCTEIFTETPQSLTNGTLLYSNYKSHMTYKSLIGISPAGFTDKAKIGRG
ncbi:uncharacterized protein LOC124265275 [Haliotis rubra]|uniref:uncharacterized protein LOC124265275 n=1 Tax=Haliotis rubra TaxID=36100 RepID=UPI001EE5A022|nr:uncharacterized protein LOC124265275 [Haliotis rubra]